MNDIWMTWGDVFNTSLKELWWSFVQFAPKLIIAILLFVIGWVLGSILAKAFEQVLKALKVDKLFQSIGAGDLFRKAGMDLDTGYFIGQVVKWFVIIIFLLPSLELIGLNDVSVFLRDDVLSFLPRVIIATLILGIATLVSDAVSRLVVAGTRSMNVHSAHMLGTIARYSILVFAFIIAIGQLGIADSYMSVLFTGIIAMISLGGALAFGLGGKDAAARFVSKLSDESSHR